MSRSKLFAVLGLLCVVCSEPPEASAQIVRHPTGVNVNAAGATSVFITFGNLDGYRPVEAIWCGELVPASPALGDRCAPGTVFGALPLQFSQARLSGQNALTDVMSIPPSVARRAYQAARGGADSRFFYVRRFVDPTGVRPDQFVTVTCRLTAGGARTPLALLDVRLAFRTEDPVLSVGPGQGAPPLEATIHYNGTGRLVGRWEIVHPGDAPPEVEDLLPEASLPVELRGTQRRYVELERFNVFLPPTGEITLPGPDPEHLPTDIRGLYQVLLRIEASDDKEGDSDLAGVGETGLAHSGAVAGFPIPPLRYYVGEAAPEQTTGLAQLTPEPGEVVDPVEGVVFSWTSVPALALYRLTVRADGGGEVLSALLPSSTTSYRAPPWLWERAGTSVLEWQVAGLDADARPVMGTGWRRVSRESGAPGGGGPR